MTKSDNSEPEESKGAGRVRHDARGNAVWHWAADTARNVVVSTSQLLRRLDLSGLSLEDDQPPTDPGHPTSAKPPSAKPASGTPGNAAAGPGGLKLASMERTRRGGGYNPYDGAAVRPAPGSNRPAAASPRRASWWQRLFRGR